MFYRDVIFLTLMIAVTSTMSANGQVYSQLFNSIAKARNEAANGIDTPTLTDEKASPGFVQRASARVYSVFERMRKAVTGFIARFLLYYSKALLRRAEGDQRGGGGRSNIRPQNSYHDPTASNGPDFSYKIKTSAINGGNKAPDALRGNRVDSRESELPNINLSQRPVPIPSFKRENTPVPVKPVVTTDSIPSVETVNQGETVNWSPQYIWNAVGPIQDVGRQKLQEVGGDGGKRANQNIPTITKTITENFRNFESSNIESSTFSAINENFYNGPEPANPDEDVRIELVKLEYIKLDQENYTSTTENTVVEETLPTQVSQENSLSSPDLTISQSVELTKSGKDFVIVVDPNLKYADHTSGKAGNYLREDSRKLEAKEAEAHLSILEEEERLQVPVSRQRGKPNYSDDNGESAGVADENFGTTNNYSPGANGIVSSGPEVTNPGTFSSAAFVPYPVQYPVPVYYGSLGTKPDGGQVQVGGESASSGGEDPGATPIPGHFLFGGKISSSSAYLDLASQIPGLDTALPAKTVNSSPEQGNGHQYLVVNTHPVAYVLGERGGVVADSLNHPVHSQNSPYFAPNPITPQQGQYREEDYNSYYQSDSTHRSQPNANPGVEAAPQDSSSPELTPSQGLLVNAATSGGHRQENLQYGETASKFPSVSSTSLHDISNINALGGQYVGSGTKT